jgi:hypothetical protein
VSRDSQPALLRGKWIMTFIQEYAIGQFGKRIVNKLAKKGIRIIGTQMIPNPDTGNFSNAEVAYQIDDNDTGRVKSAMEIIALAQ